MCNFNRSAMGTALVLLLVSLSTGHSFAQTMPYGSVKSWEVTSNVEVSKTEVFDDRSEDWSLSASGKALINSDQSEGMRYL